MKSSPLLLLIQTGLLLSIALPLSRAAIERGWTALGFTFWSVLLAGLLLWLAQRQRGGSARDGLASQVQAPQAQGFWIYSFWTGLLGVAWPQTIAFAAAPHIGTSVVALIMTLPAVFTYLLTWLIGMEQARWQRSLGIALAMSGAAALAWGRQGQLVDFSWGWFLAAVSAPLSLAIGNIHRKKMLPAGLSDARLAQGMMLGAAFSLLPVIAYDGRWWPAAETLADWGWVAVQGLVFALGYRVYFRFQKGVNPVFFSLLGYVMAVVGVLAGILWFGERWTLTLGAAMGLILAGVWLAGRRTTDR